MRYENIVFSPPMLVGVSALWLTHNTNKGANSRKKINLTKSFNI